MVENLTSDTAAEIFSKILKYQSKEKDGPPAITKTKKNYEFVSPVLVLQAAKQNMFCWELHYNKNIFCFAAWKSKTGLTNS